MYMNIIFYNSNFVLFGSITEIGSKSVLAEDFGPVILYQISIGQAPFID